MNSVVSDLDGMYQRLIDALQEGILFCDRKGIIRILNKCYANLLGGEVSSFLGKPIEDVNPATRAYVVMENGREELADLCTLPLFGNEYKFVVNRIPVRNGDAIIGMISHIQFTDPSDVERLNMKVARLYKKFQEYEGKDEGKNAFDELVGDCEKMRTVKELIQRYAQEMHPVLIQGKTGTGKELVAHALHKLGERRDEPFISINCAAIPENLLEAELFGYASGAFSGALRQGKPGLIELANGGTLFLDEVGDMPLLAQVKLLRVLEEKSLTRVGAVKKIHVDFRLITATNRNLEQMVAEGTFREDLWYRINALTIHLPPLAERGDDIEAVTRHILAKINFHGTISQAALEALRRYEWPGNVRQLSNSLAFAALHCDGDSIELKDLPMQITQGQPVPDSRPAAASLPSLSEFLQREEKQFLQDAIQQHSGNLSGVAKALGISRMTLYNKLKRYDIVTD